MIYTYETNAAEDVALAAKLEAYNAGLEKPVTTQEFISLMAVTPFMNGLVEAYAAYQLQQLVPVGVRYIAAPDSVQKQVDALLEPYTPKP